MFKKVMLLEKVVRVGQVWVECKELLDILDDEEKKKMKSIMDQLDDISSAAAAEILKMDLEEMAS